MKVKRLAIFSAIFLVLAGALFFSSVAGLRSEWFKERVRHRIIYTVQRATGGRAEIGRFNYDWKSLTAELDGFVLHGSEPPGSPPVMQAKRVLIGLKIVSLWKRDIDLSSLVIDRPQLFLTFDAKGNSNLPIPVTGALTFKQAVGELLRLKVHSFQINGGAIQAEAQFVPIDARGENLQLLLTYERGRHAYGARLTSKQFQVSSSRFRPFAAELDADAELESNRLIVQRLKLQSEHSKLDASGSVVDFERPVIDFHMKAKVAAMDLAYVVNVKDVRGGDLYFEGTVYHDPAQPFQMAGSLRGRNLAADIYQRVFQDVNFEADLQATPEQVAFQQLKLAAPGARLAGAAFLDQRGGFSIAGNLEGGDLQHLSSVVLQKPLAWSGLASGPLHMQGLIRDPLNSLEARGDLRIEKTPGGIPIAGNLDFSYRGNWNSLEFGNSQVELPQSHLTFSGALAGDLQVAVDSTNLGDLQPLLPAQLPIALTNGSARFDGTLSQAELNPQVNGNVALRNFTLEGRHFDDVRAHLALSSDKLAFSGLSVVGSDLQATGNGQVALTDWRINQTGPLELKTKFKGVNVAAVAQQLLSANLPLVFGIASGSAEVSGSLENPHGTGSIHLDNADAYGEKLNQVQMNAKLDRNTLQVTGGRVEAGPAVLLFEGAYQHDPGLWQQGQLRLKVDSNGFPISSIATVRRYDAGLSAKFQMHGEGAVRISPGRIEPLNANGNLVLSNVMQDGLLYGSFTVSAETKGQQLDASLAGDLRESHVQGHAQIQLTSDNPSTGELHVGRMQIGTLYTLLRPGVPAQLPFSGSLSGAMTFSGLLQQPLQMRAKAEIQDLNVKSELGIVQRTGGGSPNDLIFHNAEPIVLEASDGVASVQSFHLTGPDTTLTVSGSVPFLGQRPMTLKAAGALDLRAFSLILPDVRTTGESALTATLGGTPEDPRLTGSLEVKNGSMFVGNFPTSLTDVNGTVTFDRDRATIRNLTGHSGGGQIALAGFLRYHTGSPLIYNLEANAENVRFRYGGAISITANSDLKLTGTSAASVLSGGVSISKVAFNASADVGNVLAAAAAPVPSPGNQKDFVSGLQLDVHIESAPNLELSTELSRDLEGEIDLHLRGRPDYPTLLGSIVASQGDIRVFGTKYSINRGEVNFVNPAKIEPVLDLDLQTEARGITVDITVSGATNKLNINYRSDPPLQPRDIIALLTVGRAPDIASSVPNAQVTNDASGLQAGANTVLGQAFSPVSNRLSKLFGITNIKIDPLVQGITNTPQARLTVEQQVSRDITVTYITNLSETSEQIFRFEWALNARYSLIALRDDNGEFGMDIQYKRRFK